MTEPMPIRKTNPKDILVQSVFLVIVVVLIASAIASARTNLNAMGISSGFGFLDRSTGWSYSFSLVERSIDDPYRWTLFVGFLNTLFLGVISIILATLLGFAVGAARDARNFALNSMATLFVQIFRNIPLILQLVFWYAILIHMPGPRQAMSFLDLAFLSNRGLYTPALNLPPIASLTAFAFAIGSIVVVAKAVQSGFAKRFLIWLAANILLLAALVLFSGAGDSAVFSIPALKGLRFTGGITIPVELVAMIIAIVLYGAAYIAEVVKGGLRAVPKGLIEAGRSLGLSERTIWFKITMPMALRSIVPPLGNQWIFLMKATTIGVAIGFSDLFMIVSTSITQSGQTLELIGILMAAFLLINFSLAQMINLLNSRLQLVTN